MSALSSPVRLPFSMEDERRAEILAPPARSCGVAAPSVRIAVWRLVASVRRRRVMPVGLGRLLLALRLLVHRHLLSLLRLVLRELLSLLAMLLFELILPSHLGLLAVFGVLLRLEA